MTRIILIAASVLAITLWGDPASADGPAEEPTLEAGQAPSVLQDQETRRQRDALQTKRRQRSVDQRLRHAEIRAKLDRVNVDMAEFRRRHGKVENSASALQQRIEDGFLADEGQRLDTTIRRAEDASREIRTKRRLSRGAMNGTVGLQQLYFDSLR